MTNPADTDVLLTGIVKNFDVTVIQAVQAIKDGTFTGGVHIGTLETGEVGLAPFHELDSLVSEEVKIIQPASTD